jgi:hypothetical protein
VFAGFVIARVSNPKAKKETPAVYRNEGVAVHAEGGVITSVRSVSEPAPDSIRKVLSTYHDSGSPDYQEALRKEVSRGLDDGSIRFLAGVPENEKAGQ